MSGARRRDATGQSAARTRVARPRASMFAPYARVVVAAFWPLESVGGRRANSANRRRRRRRGHRHRARAIDLAPFCGDACAARRLNYDTIRTKQLCAGLDACVVVRLRRALSISGD